MTVLGCCSLTAAAAVHRSRVGSFLQWWAFLMMMKVAVNRKRYCRFRCQKVVMMMVTAVVAGAVTAATFAFCDGGELLHCQH